MVECQDIIPLRKHLQASRPDLPAFFSMAGQLVEILGKLHQQSIIHRGLKLDSIFIHPGTGRVSIIECGTAGLASAESQNGAAPSLYMGDPAYMSPEQVGRLNRAIDQRSDFYSLGIVLYEIITGQLPFQAGNPLQWVHAHMAQEPVDPGEIDPYISPAISAIIMKLLAKNAEERYHSAAGLMADLEECRRQWRQSGVIEPFVLGRMDSSMSIQNVCRADNDFQVDLLLSTIREAVWILSKETDAAKLLKGFLKMAIEIAGANKGYLIMIDGAQEFDIQHALVMTPHSPERDINMSRAAVRYVLRTLEPVVLNDVEQADIFAGDPYMLESRTKAILCWPLLFQGIPGGVIYLENSLLTGVFTPERLEILKLLIVHITYVMKLQSLSAQDAVRRKDERPLPLIEPLTERERQVLRLIADGMSNQEIAEELQLTVSTVKSHVLNIYGKLRVNRRVQAVTRAKELRLIKLPH